MSYKVYLDAIQCKRDISHFMRACDLGISDVGVPVNISFTTEQKPTDEYINKVADYVVDTLVNGKGETHNGKERRRSLVLSLTVKFPAAGAPLTGV